MISRHCRNTEYHQKQNRCNHNLLHCEHSFHENRFHFPYYCMKQLSVAGRLPGDICFPSAIYSTGGMPSFVTLIWICYLHLFEAIRFCVIHKLYFHRCCQNRSGNMCFGCLCKVLQCIPFHSMPAPRLKMFLICFLSPFLKAIFRHTDPFLHRHAKAKSIVVLIRQLT